MLAGLLPLAALAFFTLLNNAQTQRQRLMSDAGNITRDVIEAVDLELAMSFTALDALALSPRLARGDMENFRVEAQAMKERRGWANVVLALPTGQQLMNTRLPPGAPLPSNVGVDVLREAVRAGGPCVGNIFFSPVLQMNIVPLCIPIMRDGKVSSVLVAVIRPDSIRVLLQKQHVPESSVVTILDRSHTAVARSLNHEEWVGKPPSSTLLNLIRQGRNGASYTNTLEGKPVYTVYQRSSTTGWWVAVGIPREALTAPVLRSYIMLGGLTLGSLAIGLLAAFVTGRTVTRPMRELELAAVAIGHGNNPVLPRTDLPEIRLAASALIAAHIEREKLLQSERDARRAAETASKAKDEFLAMLGHELRNPLAAIANASELLDYARGANSTELAEDASGIVRRQVKHLARLTDDLLDAGRVVLGKINLERHPVELSAIVRTAIEAVQKTTGPAYYRFSVSLDPVWANADATRIDQIVANLLTNAVKYTPAPGSIDVSLRREDGQAVLRVRDTGVGIEPDLMSRVFDLFVQGQRSLDRSQGGLGIGLTLVRRLTELHGGSVEGHSEGANKGSEFVVRLPAVDPPAEPAAQESMFVPASQHTIVIVEDNDDVRMSLRTLLQLDGHEVHEAADGPSGVETVLRTQAQVALVDVGLPLMNGYEVAKAIRARAKFRVRLIAMTGYGGEDDMNRGLNAGFDVYLVKPVDPELLAKTLASG